MKREEGAVAAADAVAAVAAADAVAVAAGAETDAAAMKRKRQRLARPEVEAVFEVEVMMGKRCRSGAQTKPTPQINAGKLKEIRPAGFSTTFSNSARHFRIRSSAI